MEKVFKTEQIIQRPIQDVFDFFSKVDNLQRITPPLLDFRIISDLPIQMAQGTRIDYRLKIRGIPVKWKTRIESWRPPHQFIDTQLQGPYKTWHHTHEFEPLSENSTLMRDIVRYEVPFGLLGRLADMFIVQRDIERIFTFRQTEIEKLLNAARK